MTLKLDQRLQQGRYRIRDRLGQGGMGTVYLAEDLNLAGRLVAIKENTDTSPEAQTQFKREAVMLASLTHPNLPRVSDHFIEPTGRQYLVMDYIQGDDLREILQKHNAPLPEAVALEWIEQVMNALEYMHNWVDPTTRKVNPIIHRDIKPGNIKRTPDGRIVLVDFGLARFVEGSVTIMGARAVTPGYSPIEQYTGGTDQRSDLYALGATLYAMITRLKPPEAPTIAAGATLPLPRKLNPQISRNTERVILRAMQIQPAERYSTLREMRAALFNRRQTNRIRERVPIPFTVGAKVQPTRATARSRRRSVGITVAALLLVLAAIGTLAWWTPASFERLRHLNLLLTPETAFTLLTGGAETTTPTPAGVASPTSASNGPLPANNAVLPATSLPTIPPTVTLLPTLPLTASTLGPAVTGTVHSATDTLSATSTPTAIAGNVAVSTEQHPATTQAVVAANVAATLTTSGLTALPPNTPTFTPIRPTATPSPTQTVSPLPTATTTTALTATATNSATKTALPTTTATDTQTPPPLPTATATATPVPTATVTDTPLPTATATARPLPTATDTQTPPPLPTATPIPTATQTATPPPRATLIPTATATPVPTKTPTATHTLRPTATATRQPTRTPTSTRTPAPPTPTLLPPTNTPAPTPTSTRTLAPTLPPTATTTRVATPTPQPPALPVGGSVTLVEPLDAVLQGRRTFRWSTNVTLAENQYFELVFWPVGRDPLGSSFGPAGSIKETTLTVDLDKTADVLPHLFQPGQDYEWGVLLVELNPYRRLQYLGGGQRFRFERSSGGGGGGGGGSAPAPTNTPRG